MSEGGVHVDVANELTGELNDVHNNGVVVVGVCNGEVSHLQDQEDRVIDDDVKDHSDSSYEFVNGADDVVAGKNEGESVSDVDPNRRDENNVEIQDGVMNDENVGSGEGEGYCIGEKAALEEGSFVESHGDQLGSSDAVEEKNKKSDIQSNSIGQGDIGLNADEQNKAEESSVEVEANQVDKAVVSVEDEIDSGNVKDDEADTVDSIAEEVKEDESDQPQITMEKSIESEPNIKENRESEDISSKDVQVDFEPDNNMAETTDESPADDIPVDNEVGIASDDLKTVSSPITDIQQEPVMNCSIPNENGYAEHIQDDVSKSGVVSDSISDHNGVSIIPDVETPVDLNISSAPETEIESLDTQNSEAILSHPVGDSNVEMEDDNRAMDGDLLLDGSANDVGAEPVIVNAIKGHEKKPDVLPSSEYTGIEVEVSNEVSDSAAIQSTFPIDDPKSGNEVENDVSVDPVIDNVTNLEEKASTLSTEALNIRPDFSNGVFECTCGQPCSARLNGSVEKKSSFPTCPVADVQSESVVKNMSVNDNGVDMCCDASMSDSNIVGGSVITIGSALVHVPYTLDVGNENQTTAGDSDPKQVCHENENCEVIQKDETTISQEDSIVKASDGQDASSDIVKRPFYYLIKVPRYDDESLREQIKSAQHKVDEKTEIRDAIRLEIQAERATLKANSDNVDAAISELRAAKELARSKRREIDAAQSVINIAKNATSIDDIDVKIRNMEHWMQHDTMSLKKEKESILEIKKLKQLREQYTSSLGKQDIVQQALGQRDQTEENLKTLKKEMDGLRQIVKKAEDLTEVARKRSSQENENMNKLQAKYKAADDTRQEAYSQLHMLRKKLSEKNKYFRKFKDAEKTGSDYAVAGKTEALQRLCINEVETIMELWNNDEEFRNDYIKGNTRSTIRRLQTYDGRSLGPNEDPPVLPPFTFRRAIVPPTNGNVNSTSNNEKIVQPVQTINVKVDDNKSFPKLVEQKERKAAVKSEKPTNQAPLISESAAASNDKTEVVEKEQKPTKEEEELARKVEELRKQEEEAKLKEKRRIEEKAKAKEALERKKRIAEKAQARAELKAKREAEEKEKEREKRAKKKERKNTPIIDDVKNEGEASASSESPIETVVESGTRDVMSTKITKRPQKQASQFTKQTKSKYNPPPALRNRSRRRMQHWMWALLVALILVAFFFAAKSGFLASLGLPGLRL